MGRAMLKRLTIHRFRTVRAGTELIFNAGLNVLLGRNGSGKTSLLDLISKVLRADFSELREEEFDIAWEIEGGHQSTLSARFSNQRVLPREENDPVRLGGDSPYPSLSLVLQSREAPSKTLEIKVEGPLMQWRTGQQEEWKQGAPIDLFLPDMMWRFHWTNTAESNALQIYLRVLSVEGGPAYRFDEALETFESITERVERVRRGRSVAEPIQREISWVDPGLPGEFSGTMSRHSYFNSPLYEVPRPQPGQSSVPVEIQGNHHLQRFAQYAGLQGFSMSLAVEGSYRSPVKAGVERLWWRFGTAEFLFTEPGGATFNHHGLSFGQKRLLAFLYYLDANARYVIADELVNGMHHEWIRVCLDEIGGRQAFLTSQNPLLLDYIPLASAEDAHRTFLQCRAGRAGERSEFIWSNLSVEDAEELFKDRQVGIQQIGEILRVRGLW
jgi:energy-coupling factor transporter ATP-binding protein EcfA2